MSKQLCELIDGEKVAIKLLISQINKGVTNKGAPYLSFVLQDKSGVIDAKYWNVSEEQLDLYKAGMICLFHADVLSHNKQLQIRVQSIEILDRKQEDLIDYVRSSHIPKAQLQAEIYAVIDAMHNETIKQITKTLLKECEKDFFSRNVSS
ncbi:MAG: 3'-5' exonuclease, partial [Erysipelotrichia bacterium]|nr:3'-5' exonuclease [Erysipelotrichia bacterium]